MPQTSIYKLQLDSSPIGLVLSCGGAKGAYQAGVWKAMVETGVAERVTAISGTSVGAINAAAFAAIRDPGVIKRLWHDGVSAVVTPNFKALSPLKMLEVIESFLGGKLSLGALHSRFHHPLRINISRKVIKME